MVLLGGDRTLLDTLMDVFSLVLLNFYFLFRLVADYIFGNNTSSDKIAMTAPVVAQQQPEQQSKQKGEKIAMTAPVVAQQQSGTKDTDEGWTVHFVMPSEYTMESLPHANSNAVTVKEVEGKQMAVVKFSGSNTDENIYSHEKQLLAYIEANNFIKVSDPEHAFYNPPWALPFLRRNEVMVEVKQEEITIPEVE